jgi:hypothetical protein
VPWECYSRANSIKDAQYVDALAAAHCKRVQIGFESMHEPTLRRMSKRVTAKQNRNALDVLKGGPVGYTVFFMVGYPGETPEGFAETRDYLLEEYSGYFMLHLFSVADETMPLWSDREELQIQVDDPFDSDSQWSHIGMDSASARVLQAETLDLVRRGNDDAVNMLWQGEFQHPLMPHLPDADNMRVEKAVERLAMSSRDFPDAAAGADQVRSQLDTLSAWDISADLTPTEEGRVP